MNEDDRKAEDHKAQLAFKKEMSRHKFEYFIVLNTRNISSAPKKRSAQMMGNTLLHSSRVVGQESAVPTWKKNFDAETDPLNPRATFRKMPKTLGRHYSWWTAQELYDVHVPKFLRQVAKANQGKVTYGVWIEHGKWNGRPHVNLALAGVPRISIAKLSRIWKAMDGGSAVIRPFDLRKDTGYLWKHAVKEQVDVWGRVQEVLWMSNVWKKDRTHAKLNHRYT